MIVQFEFWILLTFGAVTALLALQFLFPRWYSHTFNGAPISTAPEVFYARQGGLAIAVQGALLIVAAFVVEIRMTALVLVGLGKLVFVLYLWLNIKNLKGLLVTALVDSVAVLAFVALLLKI